MGNNQEEYKGPSEELYRTVIARIRWEERRSARKRLLLWSAASLCACAGLVPASGYAMQELQQSGFYSYLSLLFSDASLVFASWKEFLLLLTESLPIVEITVLAGALFAFLGTMHAAVGHVKTAALPFRIPFLTGN